VAVLDDTEDVAAIELFERDQLRRNSGGRHGLLARQSPPHQLAVERLAVEVEDLGRVGTVPVAVLEDQRHVAAADLIERDQVIVGSGSTWLPFIDVRHTRSYRWGGK
jgi:hypothetical protein